MQITGYDLTELKARNSSQKEMATTLLILEQTMVTRDFL